MENGRRPNEGPGIRLVEEHNLLGRRIRSRLDGLPRDSIVLKHDCWWWG